MKKEKNTGKEEIFFLGRTKKNIKIFGSKKVYHTKIFPIK